MARTTDLLRVDRKLKERVENVKDQCLRESRLSLKEKQMVTSAFIIKSVEDEITMEKVIKKLKERGI